MASENCKWEDANVRADEALALASKLCAAGREVPLEIQLKCNVEVQHRYIVNCLEYGPNFANIKFNFEVETWKTNRLYEKFQEMQKSAKIPEENIISLWTFKLHPERAMEYAAFCRDYFSKYGQVVKSYEDFDFLRCREISKSGY